MAAGNLQRWWLRRRHGGGEWAGLLAPPPPDEWVSLDLETTGLDPRSDHILSLAAVPVRDGAVRMSERFTRNVRAERAFGIDSIRHHRITPEEAAAGGGVLATVREFVAWLGPRRLLGYNIGFDIAMLAPHVRAITGFELPNPADDLADAAQAALRRVSPDAAAAANLAFDRIAGNLGVPILGRHDALGDALTVAACWMVLQRAGYRERD